MSLQRVWIPSPNFNPSRAKNQLIVIHSAEGATDFHSLGSYFQNPAAQVSAHVGIDDQRGTIGEYLHPDNKAWAAFAANDWGVHAELCGFAAWTRAQWLQHTNMLANAADWIREEASRYGIPLVKLSGADIAAGKRGVCGHKDVTDAGAGGDHWDPGPGFPWDLVLSGANASTSATPATPAAQHPSGGGAPPFTGNLVATTNGNNARQWQQQMANRGWKIAVDGSYGPNSAGICRQFQREKGLSVDGIVGPVTWGLTWSAAIT